MLETLFYTLMVGSSVGVVCGVMAAQKYRSASFGFWVFSGAVLAPLAIVFSLFFLLELVLLLCNLFGDQSGYSEAPPGAAEAAGMAIGMVILGGTALLGAVLGGMAYQGQRDRRS